MNIFEELTWRGLVHQVTSPDVAERMGKPVLTCYIGFDPTADSLHVGSLLQILLLMRMQRAGHRPIALAGGGTGMIGDPSGKSEERNLLGVDQLEHNLASIRVQLERFLDFSPGPTQAQLVNNHDWLGSLRLLEFLRTTGKRFSVNAMLEKDSVRTRLEQREQGISFTEFTYMLLQAYDFLHLFETHGCELQLGGSDQWGNITAGVDLIRRVCNQRAFGLTSPLLTTSDGKKLGKTEKGTVWLDARRTSPYMLYQYWMRMEDRDAPRLVRMLTLLPKEEIETIERASAERPESQQAQKSLAWEVTSLVHGAQAAAEARKASEALFGREIAELDERTLLEVMAEAPSSEVPSDALAGAGKPLVELLADTGLSGSRSAAKNDIKGGGIYVNNQRSGELTRAITQQDTLHGRYVVLRKGKKNFHLIKLVGA
ncbi:MAG: tyrosine--tRNA ligase [Deltaproteobacteria bacterium]|nr:tyrosine--tRNA ligase [Deltaproteobacteria bacterium]